MSVTAVPDYIHQVLSEMNSVRLNVERLSAYPLPDSLQPIVICVVKDEIDRIPDFFRHYRSAGIEKFVFIDNGSEDGTLEFLIKQPDTDTYKTLSSFHWIKKQGWINNIIRKYGYDRWYIYVDADEQIVFQDFEKRTFRDISCEMERRGIFRVRGFLLDMYSENPILETRYSGGGRLVDTYPWFDRIGYREEKYKEIISVKGGSRTRVFGGENSKFLPELTKYPLFRINPGEYMANPHHIWPYNGNFLSPRHLAIMHFKYLPNITDKIRKAIKFKNYWNGSSEYHCYEKSFKSSPLLSMFSSCSERLCQWNDLVSMGLITPIGWRTSGSVAS
ncbi:MAG: glycosyltransferase family 2 protein, partial [Methanobacterium sp.]|nr:glycosyltransferase family 2 protein [Methanobacterium sp.]